MKNYLNLTIGAKKRLAILKQLNPIDWKKARGATFLNYAEYCGALSRGMNGETPVLYSHASNNFNREKFAHEVGKLNHTGWYCDDNYNLAKGVIVALPHGKFLHGYHLDDTGETVYFLDVLHDISDAVKWADFEAQKIAETMREDNAKFNEYCDLRDDIESNFARLRECLALRNNPCFSKLRDEARQLIKAIEKNRQLIKTEYAHFA